MPTGPARSIALVPLDAEMLRMRLAGQDFRLARRVGGETVSLHFGAEFPGDALALYPGLLTAIGGAEVVDGTFVVVDEADREAVGQVGSIGAPDGPTIEIGYGINASAQGQGIATEAVARLIDHLLARNPAVTVTARTEVANRASARVLQHNGFVVTGEESGDDGPLLVWRWRSGS